MQKIYTSEGGNSAKETMKRKPGKIVIHFDRTKIVKIIVKKPCQGGIFSTELTGNSADMPGQPIQC